MNTFKITCENGNSWITNMNCNLAGARYHFIGRIFTREADDDVGGEIYDIPCKVEQIK